MDRYENSRYSDSGPVRRYKLISPVNTVLIMLLCIIVMLAYRSRICSFLSFVSSSINNVSVPEQHLSCSAPGSAPVDKENEDSMAAGEKSAGDNADKDESSAAAHTEQPSPEESEDPDDKEARKMAHTGLSYDEAEPLQENENYASPSPFPRRLDSSEYKMTPDSGSISKGGYYRSSRIGYGYFKEFTKFSLKDNDGIKQFIHREGEVFQYAFFPQADNYAYAGTETKRRETASEAFSVLYDRVYGDGEYLKNKNRISGKQFQFASICSFYKMVHWHYVSAGGYSYGCNRYGFTVLPDQAADKPGIINGMNAETAGYFIKKGRLFTNIRRMQQVQRSGSDRQIHSIFYLVVFEVPRSAAPHSSSQRECQKKYLCRNRFSRIKNKNYHIKKRS